MKNNLLNIACLVALGTVSSTWACNASHVIGMGNSATAYTVSANTMEKGSFYIGINAETLQNKHISDTTIETALDNGAEHLHSIDAVNSYALSSSYGITDDISFNIQLPYISRRNIRAGENDAGPEVHTHGDSSGLGDASALLQYKVYDKAVKIALLAGLKMPTGQDDATDAGEVLEADLQAGSGSWDLFAGAALSKDFEDFSIHSNILYKYNNKGVAQSQLGNVFNYNIALSYKLVDHTSHSSLEKLEIDNHTGYSVGTFVELNGERAEVDYFDGIKADNTGHDIISATAGLQLATEENYSLFFAISVPIYQNFNGLQNDVNYKSTLGVGKSF